MQKKIEVINKIKEDLLRKVISSDKYKTQKKVRTFSNSPFFTIGAFSAFSAASLSLGLAMGGFPVPLLISTITGGMLGAFCGHYLALKNSVRLTKKEIKQGEYKNIIKAIDGIVKKRGEVSLTPTENNEILKICNVLFDYSLNKEDMDEIFKNITGILSEEEMITLLNNEILLALQDELKENGAEYNATIGSAVYLYCFLVIAEDIVKSSEKKSAETKVTQKYIMSLKESNVDLNKDLKEELLKLKKEKDVVKV